MYHAAIKDEAELIRDACSRRVFIANPMSLIPLLKAVRYVLDQERLNKSAAEISIVGTKLYEEITRFAAKMATIGDKLRGTVDAYNKALPALDRYIVSNSRKLKKLGSAKGAEPKKIEEIRDIEPNRFTSRELRDVNSLFEDDAASFVMAANAEDDS
jgi:DNA recombination protein RmuC